MEGFRGRRAQARADSRNQASYVIRTFPGTQDTFILIVKGPRFEKQGLKICNTRGREMKGAPSLDRNLGTIQAQRVQKQIHVR